MVFPQTIQKIKKWGSYNNDKWTLGKTRWKEAQAAILYAQGKIQEADYLLGAHLHPQIVDGVVYSSTYIPVNERDALGLITDIDGTVKKS